MNLKPVLFLLLEVKARELEGRLLLALEAAAYGFQVVIGKKNHINRGLLSDLLPPGIYFDKSITRGKETKLNSILNKGCIIAIQDEESGLLDLCYDKFLSYRSTFETVSITNSIFCWGDFDYSAWTRRYPEFANNIYKTGSPRIDYWRADFEEYYRASIDKIRNKFGDFILVASNFALANSYLSTKEIIDQGRKNGSIQTIKDEHTTISNINDDKRMFKHFIRLVEFLADKYQDTNFVVRPHPAEKISEWKKRLPKKHNIHVVFIGGISSWVRASKAILHNGCTTGIEAYVAVKTAIAYVPFISPINREIPNRLSIKCNNQEKVSDVLSKILRGESVYENRMPENDQLIESRIANVNGDTAVKRIVDVLQCIDAPKAQPIKLGYVGLKMSTKMRLNRWLNFFHNETKSMRKFPGLNHKELKKIHNNLSAVNKNYRSCEIRHLYGDVFIIENTK
jgi:surface carbohydrate biosynthesis protein